ncbi:MAG: hypothetical protein ACE5KM_11925, partial [Planctomycetaceae bacterium]
MFQSPENAMLVFRAVVVFAASTSSVLAEAPKTRIAASKATTFVTRPLRKDGSVDYAAAFNRRYGKGVTPENNAVVPLWRAFGPREIPPESRAEFFRRLGVKPPPETGPYFVPLFELTKLLQGRKKEDARDALREVFNAALDEPWTAAQYPAIAEWLTVNAGPLELLVEAAERPRFFVPLVVSKQRPMLIDGMLVENAVRLHASNAVRVLVVRAHLHLANGRIKKAARDLLACHRWARHIDRQRRLSSSFTAHALDGVAHSADRALARSKRFPSAQATAYRKQLAQLGPWNGLAETFRFSERCFQLDLLRLMAGENALDRFVELLPDDAEKDLKAQFRRKGVSRVQAAIDWNAVAKDVNRHFDRMAAIAATSDLSERRKASRKYA